MPDDRSRLARFEGELRSDIAMGDRMLRFASALQTRICREVEALEAVARFRDSSPADEAGVARVLEGGAMFARAVVEVMTVPRDVGASAGGLVLSLVPIDSSHPSFDARLLHVTSKSSLGAGWFEGAVGITPPERSYAFDSFWRVVAGRHADLVDYAEMRAAYGPEAGAGFRFDALQDPDATGEKAFLFVRDVGRALLAGWGASR